MVIDDEGMPHRTYPCNECPWRTDVPVGRFPIERFRELRSTSVQPDDEESIIAAASGHQEKFGCHKGEPGTGDDLACAGWLAVSGDQNMSVRLAVALGDLPPSTLRAGADWPQLYDSYDAMVEAQPEAPARVDALRISDPGWEQD